MPYDGNGTYIPPSAPIFPAIAGEPILSSYFNAIITDIAAGLTNCLTKDGQAGPTAAISWNGQNLSGVAALTATTGNLGTLAITTSGTIAGSAILTAANLGVPNGAASLDSGGTIPTSQLPATVLGALQYQGTWNANTNVPAIPAAGPTNDGHFYIVAVAGTTSIDGIAVWDIGDWIVSNGTIWEKIDNSNSVTSVAGLTGAISSADLKVAISLNNVTNTSDANKPVSTAQQTALDLKANLIPNIQSVASAATVTPTFLNDMVCVTALAVACQFLNWTGTTQNGWGIALRIKDNGTARALTWDTKYRSILGVALPSTTIVNKTLYLGIVYNSIDDKFDVVSKAQEA